MSKTMQYLAVSLLLCLFATAGCNQRQILIAAAEAKAVVLSDVNGHWAKESIETAIRKGYVDGYEDGTFRPDKQVSRAEFVKMVVTGLNINVGVSGKEWFDAYVSAAVSAGIHKYEDLNTGTWMTPMSRFEMSRLAVRATGEGNDDPKKWMYLATKTGLITGLDDSGELGEEESMTRAQAVTIIERVLKVKGGEKLPAQLQAVSRAELLWHKTNIFTVMPQFFGKLHPSSKWDPNEMYYETPDGEYRGELDAVIAIDLEDPNDPFRELLPPIEDMKFTNVMANRVYPVKDFANSYVLYFPGREVVNKNPEVYAKFNYVPFTISGFENVDEKAAKNGAFDFISRIHIKGFGDFPGFLVPKKSKTKERLRIQLYSPALGGTLYSDKTLLWSLTPIIIE